MWRGGNTWLCTGSAPICRWRVRARPARVAMDYAAEASDAPLVCLCEGRWKYTVCALDPEQLFDLQADPRELTNLAADPAHADALAGFREKAKGRWNVSAFDSAFRESPARRWVVYAALRNAACFPRDYQPPQKPSERCMRNHMDMNILEESQRFPRGE